MFGTLRYEPQEDGISYHSGTGLHYACDSCRARKLKCGGQKTRCSRCKNSDIECVHTEPNQGSRKRTKKNDNIGGGSKLATDQRPPSPKRTGTATRAGESVNPDLPWTVFNIEQDGHDLGAEGSQYYKESEGNIPHSSSLPSVPSLDDESIASETLSQYLLPSLSPDGVYESPWLPALSNESIAGDQDTLFQGLLSLPDLMDVLRGPKYFSMSPQQQQARRRNQGSNSSEPSLTQKSLNRSSPKNVQSLSKRAEDTSNPTRQSSSSRSPEICESPIPCSKRLSKNCECVQLTLTLLEDFEVRDSTTEPQGCLDSILNHQQDAVAQCIRRVQCPACSRHLEFLTLLCLVSGKIIATYETIIMNHTENMLKRGNESRPPASSAGEEDEPPINEGTLRSQALSLGSYQIDRPEDWDYVVCILIALQLRQVSTLISKMLLLPDNSCNGSQTHALKLLRQRIGKSVNNIKKMTSTDRLSEIVL